MTSKQTSSSEAPIFFSVTTAVVTTIAAVLLVVLVFGFASNVVISRRLKTVLQDIGRYEKPGQNTPSEARAAFLQSAQEQLSRYLDDLRAWPFMKDARVAEPLGDVWSSAGRPLGRTSARGWRGDALQFKESLYRTEQQFRDQAGPAGVVWPESFGFERFRSSLPAAGELGDLSYQQNLFEAIGEAVLSTGGMTISSIAFHPPAPVLAGEGDSAAFLVDVSLESSFEKALMFLDKVRRLSHLVTVNKFRVAASEEDPAIVTAQIQFEAVYV